VHPFEKGITAFSVLQKSFYTYVGDSSGNVFLLKLDLAQRCLADMPYWIPFAESYDNSFYKRVRKTKWLLKFESFFLLKVLLPVLVMMLK